MSGHVERDLRRPRRSGSAHGGVRVERSFSPKNVMAEAMRRRAVEAVIWGMPAVNCDLMRQAAIRAGAEANQVVFWSGLPSWKNQTLTPNPDTIYFLAIIDTQSTGPMVLEIPPADGGSITGSIDDCWQGALEDVGPAGADEGRGGKYLILPPAHTGPVPEDCIALRSTNYLGFALLRSNLKSAAPTDIAEAVAYGQRVKLYPLADAGDPPATAFVDVLDEVFDATIPYDSRFFEHLHRVVQAEPWIERDRAMIDSLKTLGIDKGRPFAPDAAGRRILGEAAREAHAWLEGNYDRAFDAPFDSSAHWALPAPKDLVDGMQSGFAEPNSYPVDARGLAYSFAFFSAKRLGAGQFYLMTTRDRTGERLRGSGTYRLRVPPDPPVSLYWSASVYDRETHAFIRDAEHMSRSSQTPEMQPNLDGSVDVIFGPRPLIGAEGNWIPTNEDGDFEVLFRLYGPEPRFFSHEWVLPDIEKVS